MASHSPTRGFGILEQYLSRQRAAHAHTAFASCMRREALLDLGCGREGGILKNAPFRERYGLDQIVSPLLPSGIHYIQQDLTVSAHLPFQDSFFDAVTMLAVIEHLPVMRMKELCGEVYRVLAAGGVFFLTTPRPGTAPLLHTLAFLRLVSPEEIAEHTHEYGFSEIQSLVIDGGFSRAQVRHGTFEWGFNTWTLAQK